MGASPKVPDPIRPPPAPDKTKAQLNALAYAETQRRLLASSGRKSLILTRNQPPAANSLLGM